KQGTAGNVSVRYQGGMLISPTGIPYEKLTENKNVVIDNNGKHGQGKLHYSEWRFHQAAYQTRPDAQAVVHNHAVHCTAVSILNRPIPAIHYMIAAAGGNSIPCAPYATFGTRELSEHGAGAPKHRKATPPQHPGRPLLPTDAADEKKRGNVGGCGSF
ncbi:class II aldolase/adducin family protein, partial [Acinetobacter baumannii]|nr:class II aldolase/adducin family protein [Acinetobacter baumannii]